MLYDIPAKHYHLIQCNANEQSENMNYNKEYPVTTMNQIDLRKHRYQISLFIVEFHTNRVSIIAANSEALFCFLLHICTQLNNYLSEKYFLLIFIRLQIMFLELTYFRC